MNTFGRILGVGLLGSTLAWAAEPPPAGRQVEFSPPGAGTMPVKPLTERDIGARSFNFQTRDASAPPDMSPVTMLPAADQVNQSRILLELLERNGAFSGGLWDGDEEDRGQRTEVGIDDLFAPSARRADDPTSRRDSDRDRRNPGTDRDSAGRDTRDNLDGRSGSADSRPGTLGDNRDAMSQTGLSDTRFLPAMDLQRIGMDSLERDRRPGADNLLDPDRSRGLRSSGFGFRDSDEERARTARMESFRSLLGGSSGITSWQPGNVLTPGVGGNPTIGAAPGGFLGIPGRGPLGASELSGGSPVPRPEDSLGASRSLQLPGRGLDLGLPSGTPRAGGFGESPNPISTMRPMELFQRKHDARMPARAF